MKTLCLYHAMCDDGFGAAWAVRSALGEDAVEFMAAKYGDEPPNVAGRDVIMVDFSYKKDVIEQMRVKASSILILDHHKTAEADLADYTKVAGDQLSIQRFFAAAADHRAKKKDGVIGTCPVGVHFDMDRSGAGIAWDFFNPGVDRPAFINYLEDLDLWRKPGLPYRDNFTIALRSYPQDFKTWDILSQNTQTLIVEGDTIQRYFRQQIEGFKRDFFFVCIGDHIVPAVNVPKFASSEVAGELAEGYPFGVTFFQNGIGRWEYSLRSRDGGVDVSEIAKALGGGGHAKAAGFLADGPPAKVEVDFGTEGQKAN